MENPKLVNKWQVIIISAMVLLSTPTYSFDSEQIPSWTKAERSRSPLTDVSIYKGQSGSPVAFARTNMTGQFIEVIAYGTNDPKMTVSNSHAISLALATARAIAYEKMAEQVGRIRVNSMTFLRNELIRVKGLKIKVEEVIKGARIFDENYKMMGPKEVRAWVKLGLLISGGSSNLLQPMYALIPVKVPKTLQSLTYTMQGSRPATKTPATDNTPTKENPSPPDDSDTKPAPPKQFTSLIVDASGLGARPALFPRILSANSKKIVYDRTMVEKMIFLQNQSIVKYSSSVEKAEKSYSKFIGKLPLIIAASGTDGSLKTDLLISPKDSGYVIEANIDTGFLKKARVVLILN